MKAIALEVWEVLCQWYQSKSEEKVVKKLETTFTLLDEDPQAPFAMNLGWNVLVLMGKNCRITLSTLGSITTNCDTTVPCLEVMDLSKKVCIEISNVLSSKSLNIMKASIA